MLRKTVVVYLLLAVCGGCKFSRENLQLEPFGSCSFAPSQVVVYTNVQRSSISVEEMSEAAQTFAYVGASWEEGAGYEAATLLDPLPSPELEGVSMGEVAFAEELFAHVPAAPVRGVHLSELTTPELGDMGEIAFSPEPFARVPAAPVRGVHLSELVTPELGDVSELTFVPEPFAHVPAAPVRIICFAELLTPELGDVSEVAFVPEHLASLPAAPVRVIRFAELPTPELGDLGEVVFAAESFAHVPAAPVRVIRFAELPTPELGDLGEVAFAPESLAALPAAPVRGVYLSELIAPELVDVGEIALVQEPLAALPAAPVRVIRFADLTTPELGDVCEIAFIEEQLASLPVAPVRVIRFADLTAPEPCDFAIREVAFTEEQLAALPAAPLRVIYLADLTSPEPSDVCLDLVQDTEREFLAACHSVEVKGWVLQPEPFVDPQMAEFPFGSSVIADRVGPYPQFVPQLQPQPPSKATKTVVAAEPSSPTVVALQRPRLLQRRSKPLGTAAAPADSTPASTSTWTGFWPKRLTMSYVWGNQAHHCVPFATNFATLDIFVAPNYRPGNIYPFLDVQGHRFANNTYAANAGIGGRYVPNSAAGFCEMLGFNLYYDYRQGSIGYFNQFGAGLEILGRRWNFRGNVYVPFGAKRALQTCVYDQYEGGYFAIYQGIESITYAFNQEVGYLAINGKMFSFEAVAGVYFLAQNQDTSHSTAGIQGRLVPKYRDYLALDLSGRYDSIFGAIWEATFVVNLPLYQLSKQNLRPCGLRDWQIYQPVSRFQVLPVLMKQCWQTNYD